MKKITRKAFLCDYIYLKSSSKLMIISIPSLSDILIFFLLSKKDTHNFEMNKQNPEHIFYENVHPSLCI